VGERSLEEAKEARGGSLLWPDYGLLPYMALPPTVLHCCSCLYEQSNTKKKQALARFPSGPAGAD
jgi:hypothetical protein